MATASDDISICTICQSELTQNSTCLPCAHTFCTSCVTDLLYQEVGELIKCPNCRTEYHKGPYLVANASALKTTDENNDSCLFSEKQSELSDMFCSTCNNPVYIGEESLHVAHKTESLLWVLRRERTKNEKIEEVLKDILPGEIDKLHRAQRQSKAVESKMVEMENAINNHYDAIVKDAEMERKKALDTLRENNKLIRGENEETIQKQKQNVARLLRVRILSEKCKKTDNKCELLELSKLTERLSLAKQEEVTLKLPVLRSDVAWGKVKNTIKNFIGKIEVTTVDSTSEEMLHEVKFERRAVTETFSELLGVKNVDTASDTLTIFYTAENDHNGAADVTDAGKVLRIHEDVPFNQYQNAKRFKDGHVLEPVLKSGVISLVSKSTKDLHFRLNSASLGMGKIRSVDVTTNKPLQTKGKTVLRIVSSPPKTFDASEDGKAFVIIEKPDGPGQSHKVRLFTKKNSPQGTLYEPPRQPFKPADIIFYHLDERQYLLIADEASDAIHVVDVRVNHLAFLRYLALGSCLLSQPVALHVDPSDRLWVTCRGCVYALRSSRPRPAKQEAFPTMQKNSSRPTACNQKVPGPTG